MTSPTLSAAGQYRKKPILIEAEQWFPDKTLRGVHWEKNDTDEGEIIKPYVITIHGQRAYLVPGDWVIPEPKEGYFYPCKPDIFEATYEPVSAPDTPREGGAPDLHQMAISALSEVEELERYGNATSRAIRPAIAAIMAENSRLELAALQAGQAAPVGVKHWHISFANGGNGYTDDAAFARDEYANGSKVTPLPTYEDLAVFALGRIHNGNRIQELKKSALDALNTIFVSKRRRDALRALAATPPAPTAAVDGEIAEAVIAWMVEYDLLDAGNEYGASDVLAVLNDLAPAAMAVLGDVDARTYIRDWCPDKVRDYVAGLEAPHPADDEGTAVGAATYRIDHDGFEGTIQGHYVTREGKRGAVLQQIGTKVVHVYGEKWLPPGAPLQGEMSKLNDVATPAVVDICRERMRQVRAEGWTPEHDDTHAKEQLAYAAACYALTPLFSRPVAWSDMFTRLWPWDEKWWKPTDRRRDLVKAGALIVAEIERLDRLALSDQGREVAK